MGWRVVKPKQEQVASVSQHIGKRLAEAFAIFFGATLTHQIPTTVNIYSIQNVVNEVFKWVDHCGFPENVIHVNVADSPSSLHAFNMDVVLGSGAVIGAAQVVFKFLFQRKIDQTIQGACMSIKTNLSAAEVEDEMQFWVTGREKERKFEKEALKLVEGILDEKHGGG